MPKIFYGWWVVLACFVVAFCVAGVTFYGFTAFIDPLVDEFGWSYTQVSFAASLSGLQMGILAPIVGFLVDRFGPRRLLLAGVSFLGLGILLFGFVQSLPMLYAAFLLIAFGAGGCTSVVTMTAVANWFDRNVGKAMGVIASGFGAGGLLVPLVVSLIAAHGWRTASFVLGVGIWALGMPLAWIVRNRPETDARPPEGKSSDEAAPLAEKPKKTVEVPFRAAVRGRSFLCVNITEIIRMMSLAAVVTHIMPYLGTLGTPRTTAGFLAAGIPLLSIVGRFGFGWLGDLFDKRRVMAVAYVFMTVGMLAFGYAGISGLIYVFLCFFSVGFGGIAVLRGAILREYFGRHSFGKLMGIMMGVSALGGIFGPTIAGWVFDTRGSYHTIWLFLCGLIAVAVLLTFLVEPRSRAKEIGSALA